MAGYNWGAGKSNNAVWAEEVEGKVTKSKITAAWLRRNEINETATFIKFLITADVIWPDEWHHTSKYFNETDYYSAETWQSSKKMGTWPSGARCPRFPPCDAQMSLSSVENSCVGSTDATCSGTPNRPGKRTRRPPPRRKHQPGPHIEARAHPRKDTPCPTHPISRASTS